MSEPISDLRSVTCHTGSHSVTCHPTGERAPPQPQSDRPVLDLPTPEGWKAELTYVVDYIPRWFTCLQAVTHRSINRARRTVTSLIGSDALPLHHAYRPVVWKHQRMTERERLKYGKTWGNADPPPLVFSPKHSPTSSFQKMHQGAQNHQQGAQAKTNIPHLCIYT